MCDDNNANSLILTIVHVWTNMYEGTDATDSMPLVLINIVEMLMHNSSMVYVTGEIHDNCF